MVGLPLQHRAELFLKIIAEGERVAHVKLVSMSSRGGYSFTVLDADSSEDPPAHLTIGTPSSQEPANG